MKSVLTSLRVSIRPSVAVACALAAFPLLAAEKISPQLAPVRTVYILPMSNGLDQYLANHLTRDSRFQVVADPQGADAILTDRLGESFEAKLEELYPRKTEDEEETTAAAEEERQQRARMSSFSRARGNVYLVDRKTRVVLWSHYKRPRNAQPEELDRLGEYFAAQLKKNAGSTPPPAPVVPEAPQPKPEPEEGPAGNPAPTQP